MCTACGAEKDLPLARCGGCGHLPSGREREIALVASTRVLDGDALAEVQARVRRGERIDPSEALRAKARAALYGSPREEARFSPKQVAALVAANVLLTPLLGWAVWLRYRAKPGPAARQALLATAPVSALLAAGWVVWVRLR
ncbi:MAG: hypothetical protein ACOZNI_15925 [Myxococcota bacterium]